MTTQAQPTAPNYLIHFNFWYSMLFFVCSGANSVAYLTVGGLKAAVSEKAQSDSDLGYCTACLTGDYPIALDW